MEYFYIIGISIIIIVILFFLLRAQTKKKYEEEYQKKIQEIAQNEADKIKNITILQCKAEADKLEEIKKQILNNEAKLSVKEATLSSLNSMIKEKENFNSSLQKIREEELNKLIEKEKEKRLLQLDKEIEEWSESAQEAAKYEYDWNKEKYNNEISIQKEEIKRLFDEIEDYRTKREAINQEILRSRAINEQQEFYRIQLTPDAKHDIDIINSIRPQIYKFETLNKLLYDNYISKPAKEMTKRVLQGKDPSGIYKVTNIETKEIYIGKSVTVASRWINHIKAAEGLDGVADSQFQRALRQYGVENFTWELLEEVSKEKLGEREKYWITFYDTTHYGYNMKVG
jgi:chromosome segregation ATPase